MYGDVAPMETSQLTPDQLDAQASRLHATDAWQSIVTGWEATAPTPEYPTPDVVCPTPETEWPGREPRHPAPGPPAPEVLRPETAVAGGDVRPARAADWRDLLSLPVDRLVEESLRTRPTHPSPARERPLPGRLGAVLPDFLHAWRRVGQPDVRPSVHLAYARQILTEWGWQNTPYRLRNARGSRCLCGAMLTAHRLGYGSLHTVDRAGAWMITELRSQGWTELIGPWNRHPGRTAEDALALIDATIHRASVAGQ